MSLIQLIFRKPNATFHSIENVFNAASMRPTSQFSKMVFIDSASGLELTEYDQKVLTIANEELGQIIRETALVR